MNQKMVSMEICRPDEIPDQLRTGSDDSGNRVITDNGKIYLQFDHTVISCTDNPAGRELVYNILLACRSSMSPLSGREDLFYRVLNEPGFIPDQNQLKTNRVNPAARRYVVVFRSSSPMSRDLAAVLSDIAPMEQDDTVIPVDYQTAAFIRETGFLTADELKEYTEAVIGTMEDEGITGIKAGIGNEAARLDQLRNSFSEGMDALSTGMRFHSRDAVYLYSGQMLDRILDSIPNQKKEEIRKRTYIRGTPGGLSAEMLETVRVFFRNDLNLTAASKQLFIHRNTLNYRLDKIKKETGLDLRSFEDAVIFRIISGIPDDI